MGMTKVNKCIKGQSLVMIRQQGQVPGVRTETAPGPKWDQGIITRETSRNSTSDVSCDYFQNFVHLAIRHGYDSKYF